MVEKRIMTYDKILMTEEFLAYMKEKDEKGSKFWEKLTENNPENKKEFEKAVRLYELLTSYKKVKYADSMKQKSVNRLINNIIANDKEIYKNKNRYVVVNIWKLVASVIILIGLSFLFPRLLNLYNNLDKNKVYHEVIVPSGEKSQVLLSDRTMIWLNSESRLKYSGKFKKSERAVFLEGEGYFDVSKVRRSNFIVYTQNIKVEALGTIFNIKSYPADQTIETTLVEGSLKVEDSGNKNKFSQIILKPNERFVYRKYADADTRYVIEKNHKKDTKSIPPIKQITINRVNTENITCWKDYLLVFDNETLEEMAVKMSRWYKLKVNILDDELKNHRFTGKFINNETIFNVFEAINLTTPIDYTVTNNEVNINFSKSGQKLKKKK